MSTDTIGTGGTHSTIAEWAAQRVSTEVEIGQLKAESFAESAIFNGVSHTATNYCQLECESGAYHDGRSNAVSGKGNARIIASGSTPLTIYDEYFHIKGVEIDCGGYDGIVYSFLSTSVNRVHHSIAFNASNATNCFDSDVQYHIYRNIIYDCSDGIRITGASSGSVSFYNTAYKANRGLVCTSSNVTLKYNASFDNTTSDIYPGSGTYDYNFTSDSYSSTYNGTNGEGSLTASSQFTDVSNDFTDTDLTVKSGADLIDNGVSLSTTTYPDIDIPCNDIEGSAISGTWDIGACELVSAVIGQLLQHSGMDGLGSYQFNSRMAGGFNG